MEQVRVRISGRVQGVGFRYATRDEAVAQGLTGWVKNLRDGTVEALFEGSGAPLEAMLSWCAQGPALARVTSVVVLTREAIAARSVDGFEIRVS